MNEQEIKYQKSKERVTALRFFGGILDSSWEEKKLAELMKKE